MTIWQKSNCFVFHSSQPDLSGDYALVEPAVDADVLALPGVQEVERVAYLTHVKPLLLQQVFLELVSA